MARLKFLLICCFLTLPIPNLCHADIVIEFASGGVLGNSFDASIGSSITVELFVTESGANTELSSDGLIGFGTVGTYSPLSGTGATVGPATVIDPAFDTVIDNSTTGTLVNLAAVDSNAADGFPSGTTIRLGQFDIAVSALGVTSFSFDDYDPRVGFSDFATPMGTDLDPIIFAGGRSFSFNVNAVAVPEPRLASLIYFFVAAFFSRRRM